MITVEEATAQVLSRIEVLEPERVPLLQALTASHTGITGSPPEVRNRRGPRAPAVSHRAL